MRENGRTDKEFPAHLRLPRVLTKLKGGLSALYRTLELSGANPLKEAHAAVLAAHGFSVTSVLRAWILALKGSVAAGSSRRHQ